MKLNSHGRAELLSRTVRRQEAARTENLRGEVHEGAQLHSRRELGTPNILQRRQSSAWPLDHFRLRRVCKKAFVGLPYGAETSA